MAKRTDDGYIQELIKLGKKIEAFLMQMDDKDNDYTSEVAVKLRILYIPQSGRKCYFTIFQEHFNFEFKVWVRDNPKLEEIKKLMPIHSFNSTIDWLVGGEKSLGLIEAFNETDQILHNGENYSMKDMVKLYANKLGGAHIDEVIPGGKVQLQNLPSFFDKLSIPERAVMSLGQITIPIIKIMLKYVIDKTDSPHITPTN